MNLQSSFFVRHIYSIVVPALPLTASSAFAMVVMMALRFLPAFRKERAASIFGSMDEVPNSAAIEHEAHSLSVQPTADKQYAYPAEAEASGIFPTENANAYTVLRPQYAGPGQPQPMPPA